MNRVRALVGEDEFKDIRKQLIDDVYDDTVEKLSEKFQKMVLPQTREELLEKLLNEDSDSEEDDDKKRSVEENEKRIKMLKDNYVDIYDFLKETNHIEDLKKIYHMYMGALKDSVTENREITIGEEIIEMNGKMIKIGEKYMEKAMIKSLMEKLPGGMGGLLGEGDGGMGDCSIS